MDDHTNTGTRWCTFLRSIGAPGARSLLQRSRFLILTVAVAGRIAEYSLLYLYSDASERITDAAQTIPVVASSAELGDLDITLDALSTVTALATITVKSLNADNMVTVKPIDLGPTSGERVALRSGPSFDDRVVIDGFDKLRNGAKIAARGFRLATAHADGGTSAPTSPDGASAVRAESAPDQHL
jgi:hypothetical protein